jgi:hypothetical protein
MNQNPLTAFAQLEVDLWEAADQLRADSKQTSSEDCMLVLSVPRGDLVRAWCAAKNDGEVTHG